MTTDEALERLGSSTARAAVDVLRMVVSGEVVAGEVSVLASDEHPLRSLVTPAVVADVSYINGVTGGNVFGMGIAGARKLARAMMGSDPDAPLGEGESPDELSELELSAVGEALNQMMAAAAGATGTVMGLDVQLSPPRTRRFATSQELTDAYEPAPHAIGVSISLLGEPCRLVQLVPNAFVVRMTRALDELGSETTPDGAEAAAGDPSSLALALQDVTVDFWAELGRTRMPTGRVTALPSGALIELDRFADDPIDLYVNGTPLGTGRLVVLDGSEWGVRIEQINGMDNEPEQERGGAA